MKTIAEYTDLQVPSYALSYLVNGDASGLEDEDKQNIDAWFKQFKDEAKAVNGHVIFNPDTDSIGFVHCPEFGLACDCATSTVLICN